MLSITAWCIPLNKLQFSFERINGKGIRDY